MKRLLLTCIIAVACNACDPVKYQVGEYYVKNLTPYDLTVVAEYKRGDEPDKNLVTLGVGETQLIFPQSDIKASHNNIFGDDFHIYETVYTVNSLGEEICRWKHGDIWGHNFFSWNSWDEQRETRHEDGKDVIYYTWTFTILPEDIAAAEGTENN